MFGRRTQGTLVTVGVPVYNDAANLERCLQSIVDQTMAANRVEVICVDDGSTDDTAEVIAGFQRRLSAPNFVYLWQENTGTPATARNRVIEQARGEFIYFVDGDDYLGNRALQAMYDLGHKNAADVVLGPFVGVNRKVPTHVFRSTQPRTDFFSWNLIDSMNVLKMFRTSYVRDLPYRFNPEIRLAEDHPFTMSAYLNTDAVAVVSGVPCYYWVRHPKPDINRAHLTGGVLPVPVFYRYIHETFRVIAGARLDEERRAKANAIYWKRLLDLDLITESKRARSPADHELSFRHLHDIAETYSGRAAVDRLEPGAAFMLKLILRGDFDLYTHYLRIRKS